MVCFEEDVAKSMQLCMCVKAARAAPARYRQFNELPMAVLSYIRHKYVGLNNFLFFELSTKLTDILNGLSDIFFQALAFCSLKI